MATDNIFSGLKVVDLASFIAGPGAATMLSDFGADVIKVEPPEGELWRIGQKIPPQPHSDEPYPFHLANRNKRSVALNLKTASAQQVLERLVKWADVFVVNTPHPARKKLKLEYDDVAQWNPRNKTKISRAPGYTRICIERKEILPMPRIGTRGRESPQPGIRFRKSGLRLHRHSLGDSESRAEHSFLGLTILVL